MREREGFWCCRLRGGEGRWEGLVWWAESGVDDDVMLMCVSHCESMYVWMILW